MHSYYISTLFFFTPVKKNLTVRLWVLIDLLNKLPIEQRISVIWKVAYENEPFPYALSKKKKKKKSLSVGYIGIFYIVYISVFLWIVAGMAEEMLSFL